MQREHHACLLHQARELTVGLHHHHRIGRLEGYHHVKELSVHTHLHPFHGSQCHGLRRISVLFYNVFTQGTMVQANPDGPVVLFALFQELPKELAGFFMVRMEVSRVDTDFLHHRHHGHSHLRREVDIGHQGRLNTLFPQRIMDLLQGGHVRQGGNGDTDELRTHRCQAAALRHGSGDIRRMGIAHSLDHNGVAAANQDIAHADGPGFHQFCHCLFCCCSSIIFRASLRSCARVWP